MVSRPVSDMIRWMLQVDRDKLERETQTAKLKEKKVELSALYDKVQAQQQVCHHGIMLSFTGKESKIFNFIIDFFFQYMFADRLSRKRKAKCLISLLVIFFKYILADHVSFCKMFRWLRVLRPRTRGVRFPF